MVELSERILTRNTVAEGKIVRFEQLSVSLPNGATALRDVVRHPGGCVVVPLDGEGNLYLVRQYRTPIETLTLELPAGKLEQGEDPLLCAKRELLEETGIESGTIRRIASVYTSPGFCDEVIHVFLARELKRGPAAPDGDEFLHMVKMPLDALLTMVWTGEIRDVKTVLGILIAEREYRAERR